MQIYFWIIKIFNNVPSFSQSAETALPDSGSREVIV